MIQMGKLIRGRRKQMGLSQAALGEGIMSKSEMSRVENGLKDPDIFELDMLLRRLGASLEYFEILVSGVEQERLLASEHTVQRNTVVIAEGEFIKDMRKAKGFSQEQLCENICARETLSNIENGRTPNQKILKTLSARLEEPWVRYFGYVESQELELYALVKRYQELVHTEAVAADELLDEIRDRLDLELPINKQFVESSEILSKKKAEILSVGETLAALERCLRYTMPEYDGNLYRIPHSQETVILEEIVQCMKQLKRTEAAQYLSKRIAKKCGKKIKVS